MMINGNDSTVQENMEIVKRDVAWFFASTVLGQNENKPVSFKIIYSRGTEFICENPTHDFPQRIAYRRIQKQLFASIEGLKNGKYGKQNFDFSSE